MLPPLLDSVCRIRPRSEDTPSAEIETEQNSLASWQIFPAPGRARYQDEVVAQATGFIEGGRICGVTVQ